MGLIRTVNPLTGDIISHEIEGDSPTQEETLEIQQYMSLLGKQMMMVIYLQRVFLLE